LGPCIRDDAALMIWGHRLVIETARRSAGGFVLRSSTRPI
jgi:hypothetical protein